MIELSTLVVPRDASMAALTSRCETDATTAMTRGLAEYMRSLSIEWPDAGMLRFARTFDRYADFEAGNEYPRAVAYTADGVGEYNGQLGQWPEGEVFVGGPLPAGGGLILEALDELVLDVTVEIEVDNPEERIGFVAMLERGFRPYPGGSGFMLELPHYHNARARYTARSIQYIDSADDPARNYRRARTVLQSRIPVIVPHMARPAQEIRHRGTVSTTAKAPSQTTAQRGRIT